MHFNRIWNGSYLFRDNLWSAVKYKILYNNNNCSHDTFVCLSLDCIFCVTYLCDIPVMLHFYFQGSQLQEFKPFFKVYSFGFAF